jgi:hypothetical protein
MFGRRNKEVPFSPLNDCGLLKLSFDTQTRTQQTREMVPDRTTQAYQQAMRDGGGDFSEWHFNYHGGTYVEATVPTTVTKTLGTLSCRRIEKQEAQPLTRTVEDRGRGREIVAAELGREVTGLYCQSCPYRRTGNLDPLAAAQYDLDVAQAETAAAQLETHRRQALHELEQIGRLPELPAPSVE